MQTRSWFAFDPSQCANAITSNLFDIQDCLSIAVLTKIDGQGMDLKLFTNFAHSPKLFETRDADG
jgi:hypothetical protein